MDMAKKAMSKEEYEKALNVIKRECEKQTNNSKEKFFEFCGYVVLASLIVGQCTVGSNFIVGQCVYLFANIVAVIRTIVLHRPMADKVKDCSCLAITVGLLAIKFLGGIIS